MMRYFDILAEAAVEEPVANAPVDAPVEPEVGPTTKVFYHVTTKNRLKAIQERGIEPNHNRRYRTGYGNQLGERGKIYLISDFPAAVRWAHKKEWERFNGKLPDKSNFVIICVRADPA